LHRPIIDEHVDIAIDRNVRGIVGTIPRTGEKPVDGLSATFARSDREAIDLAILSLQKIDGPVEGGHGTWGPRWLLIRPKDTARHS
jgi:hypothetical protein